MLRDFLLEHFSNSCGLGKVCEVACFREKSHSAAVTSLNANSRNVCTGRFECRLKIPTTASWRRSAYTASSSASVTTGAEGWCCAVAKAARPVACRPPSSIAGGATLAVDGDAGGGESGDAARRTCDFVVNTLDEALRALKNEVRVRRPLERGADCGCGCSAAARWWSAACCPIFY